MNGTGQITLSGASTYSGGLFANSGRVFLTGASAGGSGIVRVPPGGKVASGAGLTSRVDLLGGTFFGVGSPGSAASNDFVATAGNTTTVSLSDPDNAGVRSEVIVTGTLKGSGDITSVISTNAPHPDGGVGFRLRGTAPSDFTGTIFVGQSVKFEVQTGQAGPFSPAGNGKIVFTAGEFTGGLNGNYSQFNVRNNFAGNTIIDNNVEVVGTGFVNLNMAGTGADGAISRLGNLRIGGQQIGVNKNATPNQVLEFTSVTLTGGDPTFSPTTPGFGAGATGDMRLGPISELVAGTGIIVNGQTTLTLAGANTYTGTTKIVNGTVRLAVPGALPPNSPLVVDGGTLDLNTPSGSSDQTVPSLAGVGGVITNTDAFTTRTLNVVQNTDTVFLGGFSGNVALSKSGTGVLALGGFVNVPASTTVNAGMLAVNGSLTGAVTVQNAGSLGGSGIIDGLVLAKLGGAIAPGTGPGTLTAAQVTLESDAFLMIELAKATPGAQPLPTDYDILSVVGSVTLGNSALILTPGAGIEQNDIFTILPNDGVDPITGTFSGLPNGALFTAAGQAFRISYFDDASTPAVFELAGGNDIALLAVPEPGSFALLLGGLAIAATQRRRRS